MPIPTVTVETFIHYNDNTPAEGVIVTAVLQSAAQNDDGYIVPTSIEAVVDATGNVSLELWPNDNGVPAGQTFYKIEAVDCKCKKLLDVIAIVPESAIPLDLEDIGMPIQTLSLGNASGNVASIRRIDTEEGIIGGGDLSTNRTHKLDLTTISVEETTPTVNHIIAIQDPLQPDSVKYVSLDNLPGVGYPCEECYVATAGQTEIFVVEPFSPDVGQIQLTINGRDICQDDYDEEAIVDPTYSGKLILAGGIANELEGGEEILVRILKAAPLAFGAIDASQVTYSGGGSVEDALNLLFSATGVTPWQIISTNYNAIAGDRLFIDSDTGSFNVTLPPSPNVGDSVTLVEISDLTGNVGSILEFPVTILRNGNLIMEIADDLIINQSLISIEMIYAGATHGWRIVE